MGGLLPVVTTTNNGLARAGTNVNTGSFATPKWYLIMDIKNGHVNGCTGIAATYSNVYAVFFNCGITYFNNRAQITFKRDSGGSTSVAFKYKNDGNSVKVWILTGALCITYMGPFDIIEQEPPADAEDLISQ